MPVSTLSLHLMERLLDFLGANDDRLHVIGDSHPSPPDVAGFLFEERSRRCCAIPAEIWRNEIFPEKAVGAAKNLDAVEIVLRRKFTVAERGPVGPNLWSEWRVPGVIYPSKSLQQRRSFCGRRAWYYVIDVERLVYLLELTSR